MATLIERDGELVGGSGMRIAQRMSDLLRKNNRTRRETATVALKLEELFVSTGTVGVTIAREGGDTQDVFRSSNIPYERARWTEYVNGTPRPTRRIMDTGSVLRLERVYPLTNE